jgi:hypothetical protein
MKSQINFKEKLERLRRKIVAKRMIELRNTLGKIKEDSAEWVRQARKERDLFHDSGD